MFILWDFSWVFKCINRDFFVVDNQLVIYRVYLFFEFFMGRIKFEYVNLLVERVLLLIRVVLVSDDQWFYVIENKSGYKIKRVRIFFLDIFVLLISCLYVYKKKMLSYKRDCFIKLKYFFFKGIVVIKLNNGRD